MNTASSPRNPQFAGSIGVWMAVRWALGLGLGCVRGAFVPARGHNKRVDLARISWLVTVGACLIAVLVLVIQGYIGYAGVTLAVAVCAAVNLV